MFDSELEVEIDEVDVHMCVRVAMQNTLPNIDLSDPTIIYLHESIVNDIIDDGDPRDLQSAAQRFGELIEEMGSEWDASDVSDFCSSLIRNMSALKATLVEEAAKSEPGYCAMCERNVHLTRHHLIPRALHDKFAKKGRSKELLSRTISICRPCHSAVHNFLELKELGDEYNTLEKLMSLEKLRSFVSWMAKQTPKPLTSKSQGVACTLKQKR
mmetsp:Transcript_4464/g.6031  ORF Transcript_4464/g.6031 Transcript_4464/m.6031 type:complete len:213 (-) Transcript_4464:64-702(-)|eukprot:CAMPEP_0196591440 /NCGR_PEP_ID=MMETSP1081-20130531/69647_1 /TAXON_ID=36882 /ORGANISM="Pyramimonas amylifera, Strain CCMP720" /LENGTH=212 /DNA_ID=CAMNT_0041914805 /DNA_START=96 /DNA_END=734 /DNA_ORIENTATION=+